MSHWWRGLTISFLFATSCTKANPAFNCVQSTCTDPNYPYCDADGSIGGTPGECIAVTCTAGDFGSCDGATTELVCNNSGTGYTQVQCANGCDPTSGCNACAPNQTVCANGVVTSCDGSGTQTSMQTCPLGCFADQPRCRDIDPSNRLGTYLDMVQNPADLDMGSGSWFVDASRGTVSGPGPTITVPNFLAPSATGGPAIRVFVVNNLNIGNVDVFADSGMNYAAAFLAAGTITISGTLNVDGSLGSTSDPSCVGGQGFATAAQENGACIMVPGGGGGGATGGASTGTMADSSGSLKEPGGAAFGTDPLEPLIGGCAGGGAKNTNTGDNFTSGTSGGGAIQLSSRVAISVRGQIVANGQDGTGGGDQGALCTDTIFGAGAGGSVLLEAPAVSLAAGSVVSAIGGKGAGCQAGTTSCGTPGAGGTGAAPPGVGGSISWNSGLSASTTEYIPGGGGGGAGRIRINTPNGSYSADSTASLNAILTTGILGTR
jgi:hypothetical protein